MKIIPHDELIKKIDICIAACNFCASSCLKEENVKMMAKCISMDIDCAEVCRTTAILLARDSPHGKHLLKECIELCDACAAECGMHEADHCQACAKACRECSEACKAAA
ncbi:MAG: four-helix bundle copper-binding protein [Ferruginibacter sp.]